jgi:hypothetical protein
MPFQSKDASVSARELEAQTVVVAGNLVAGSSNLGSDLVILNGTIGATVITLAVFEPIQSVLCVRVSNRATGAIIPHTAAPVVVNTLAAGTSPAVNTISVTVDGTSQSDVCIEFIYIIA